MKFVRENPELVMDAMRKRNANVNLDEFLELEKKLIRYAGRGS